jgi:multidrug resistance efflux pump
MRKINEAEVDVPIAKTEDTFYRESALRHHLVLTGDGRSEALRVSPPWAWAVFLSVATSLTAATSYAFVAHVDITSKGKGVLRATGGVRTLYCQLAGVVALTRARSGDHVVQGQVLVELESASVEAALLQAEKRLELLRNARAEYEQKQDKVYGAKMALLKRRKSLLNTRLESLRASTGRLVRRQEAFDALTAKGYVGTLASDEAREESAEAERLAIATREDVSVAELQTATLQAQRQSERWRWQEELATAEAERNALRFSLEQGKVRASQDGYVEALLVRPGDVVETGAPLARLVAGGKPVELVAFLPERDRAFVAAGTSARVEVEQLPYAEFGTLRATVTRVATDLAAPQEIRWILGSAAAAESEPVYRVDLTLRNDDRLKELSLRLRPGMLITSRFALRTRRLISLLLDPLRRWLR